MLSTLIGYFFLPVLATQVRFPESGLSQATRITGLRNSDTHLDSNNLDNSLWELDEPPLANATGHLVFETVNSLLQHWPNTRYRNGHAVVPGVIPKGTLLYHGTLSNEIPTVPEWTSTDPEHSILFCRDDSESGCWHLTLATTRPLKVLYFDGTSAGNSADGTLDTQDIIVWGEIRPEMCMREGRRIEDLCKWGAQYAIDAYIRMEMDFEVLLCDFTAGLEVVSFSNLAWIPPTSMLSGPMSGKLLPYMFEVMHAGSWHNRYPGDTRIDLDLARIVSFYDTTLAPSLIDIRAGQERCDHRIKGISSADANMVSASLSHALKRSQDDRSGVDWKTLFRVIIDRYSDRLDLLNHLLNSTSEGDALIDQARKVHVQLRVMLTPYILHNTAPPRASESSGSPQHSWATPIFKACGTTHTSSIASFMSNLNPSERLLLRAVQETTREICRITTKMWVAGVLAGLDEYFPLDSSPDLAEIARLTSTWKQQLNDLMEWLDWSVWVRCRPGCGPEEMCYLPSWPINVPGRPWPPPGCPFPDEKHAKTDVLNASFADRVSFQRDLFTQLVDPVDDWRKPKPKCVRRVEPYNL